jgi:flagellar biosynthesis anti-sigma factor FlgM
MKVSNKDSVDLSQVARSKHGGKAGKTGAKGAEEASSASAGTGIGAAAGVEISSEAKSIAAANSIAKSSDVDEAKIARVKAMINGGTYKPDFGKVADKMINETLLQESS